jgi:hypothetical protein
VTNYATLLRKHGLMAMKHPQELAAFARPKIAFVTMLVLKFRSFGFGFGYFN